MGTTLEPSLYCTEGFLLELGEWGGVSSQEPTRSGS